MIDPLYIQPMIGTYKGLFFNKRRHTHILIILIFIKISITAISICMYTSTITINMRHIIEGQQKKHLLLCLMLVGERILDYTGPSPTVNRSLNGAHLLYKLRGAPVGKDPHFNHQWSEQKVIFLFVVYL